jgi:hypothetical protein
MNFNLLRCRKTQPLLSLQQLTYDFGFLASAYSLKPPTYAFEEGKIVGIDGGVDFSFKQHSMTTKLIFIHY